MNLILPLILISSSLAVFFGYIDPNYKGSTNQNDLDYNKASILFLEQELGNYNEIASSSNKIVAQRQDLIAKKNTISETDTQKLERLLPSNIDNIRLIIEISKIAESRNLVAKNISIVDMSKNSNESIGQDNTTYGTLSLKFTVNSTYNNFLNFLQDLEKNLRLIDITNISFSSTDNNFYDFNVSLNTYWLK